jgi:2,3-diketo-5-methylthio-1-phosphopentane phosphatase
MLVDLPYTSVFLDFDGTISTADIGLHLLARFGAPGWQDISSAYERGEIGSRECLIDEWTAMKATEEEARAVAAEVPIDPDLAPLVEGLRSAGADVTVVSDGFGFYVHEVCDPLGLRVVTNAVDFATDALEFPHEDRCCPCSTCGVCKQAPIKEASRAGRETVLVGDGVSDRRAAMLADVVLAKGGLRAWCETFGIAHHPFETLADVRALLLPEGVGVRPRPS